MSHELLTIDMGLIKYMDPKRLEKIMSTKTSTEGATTPSTPEEHKDQNSKYNFGKFEYDLYHEEDDVSLPVVRVKHVSMPNKGERWKIFEDNKVVFVVEGAKLNNKEKEFLRGIDGVNFLIAQHKQGIKSFNSLKGEIKKRLK